jgi:hypothetical protein
MVNKPVQTRTSKIWIGADGIMYISAIPESDVVIDDAVENVAVSIKMAKGKKYPALVNMKKVRSITRDAREYFAGEEARKPVINLAMLVGSPLSEMMGNLFMKLSKPQFSTKMFTSEEKAIEWLKRIS